MDTKQSRVLDTLLDRLERKDRDLQQAERVSAEWEGIAKARDREVADLTHRVRELEAEVERLQARPRFDLSTHVAEEPQRWDGS